MISFIWPPGESMIAGTGGSETYTAGHVRELLRRGIKAQVITVGARPAKLSQGFAGVPIVGFDSKQALAGLVGAVVFVNNYFDIPGRSSDDKVAVMLHNTIPNVLQEAAYEGLDVFGKTIIATSIYSAQQWALYLDTPSSHIKVVPPFADPIFGSVKRPEKAPHPRIIFAGRLSPDKGIYTLLEALHQQALVGRGAGWEVSIVAAGIHVEAGRTLARMLRGFPYAKVVPAQTTVIGMARLLAANDILVMPSVYAEPFGMLSVEAQHVGCRVVASNVGGLSQTHCGLLTLVKPHSPEALVGGIEQAIALGAPTEAERESAKKFFTLKSSVDGLIHALHL